MTTPDAHRYQALLKDYGALLLAVGRVRALHSPAPNGPVTCNGCQAFWPCPTIAALDGGGDVAE